MKPRKRESEAAAVEDNNRRAFEGVRDYITLMLESRALLGRHGNWLAFSAKVAARVLGSSAPFDSLIDCTLKIASDTWQGSARVFLSSLSDEDYAFIDINDNMTLDEGCYPYWPEIQNVLAAIPELGGDQHKILSEARDSLTSSLREFMKEHRQEILQEIFDGGTEKKQGPPRH